LKNQKTDKNVLPKHNLTALLSQNRCSKAADNSSAYDCMVDQPDGSMKKTRYFMAMDKKNSTGTSASEGKKD
jgi:hypothetical protein